MTDSALSTQQLAVIAALSNGASMTDAAAQAGVHRNTIANWRRNLLPFRDALSSAQYDRSLYFREKMEEQAGLAVETIHQILTDPKASASVRLKAAITVLQVATTPPEPERPTAIQSLPEAPPEVHNDAQTQPQPAPPSASSTFRRETPKVGRNDTCPCGSGQKYKRCCLLKADAPPAPHDKIGVPVNKSSQTCVSSTVGVL